jgi:hypothetical protein
MWPELFCSQRKLIEGMPVLWFSYVDKINFLVMSEVSRYMGPYPYDGMGLGWRAFFENMALDACITDLFYLTELKDSFLRVRSVSRTGRAAAARVWLDCAVCFVQWRADGMGCHEPEAKAEDTSPSVSGVPA